MAVLSPPKVDHKKEVRFAVVMYGGVSLAIYINGIAQELLSLVRSTAESYEDDGGRRSLSSVKVKDNDKEDVKAQKLTGTERVYRKLSYLLSDNELLQRYKRSLSDRYKRSLSGGNGQDADLLDEFLVNGYGKRPETIRTGFVIDILSGTSAGGINAIFLAKALANNQSMEILKQLWVREGDIGVLINDKLSLANLHLKNQNPPKSLLNSRRMYLQLLMAFDGMDAPKPSKPNYQSPYVKELDLFVTTTDIAGTLVPLQLCDKIVYEKRHRNVFHLKYGTEEEFGQECNHFLRKYNPFLAFAARCTSSFPFAFEPMRLCELDSLLSSYGDTEHKATGGSQSDTWKSFFRQNIDVAFDENGKGGAGTLDFDSQVRTRSYGDGGYLDNKPFSYATESLSHRQSTLPVERKLIYIEPSPDHPEDERQGEVPPNVLLNAKAALIDLPTYETIREDLQRVLQRNRTFRRIANIVEASNEDLDRIGRIGPRYDVKSSYWRLMDMEMMVKYRGIYFLPYRRLRISSVTDDLTELVARIKKLDERSDQFVAVRALLRAWRDDRYVRVYKDKRNAELVLRILNREELPAATDQATLRPTVEAPLTDEEIGKMIGEKTQNAFLDYFDYSYRFRRLNYVQSKIDFLIGLANKPAPEAGESKPVKDARDMIGNVGQGDSLAVLSYLKSELAEVHKTLRTAVRRLQAGPRAVAEMQKHPPHSFNRLLKPELNQAIVDFYEAFAKLLLDDNQLKFVLGMPGEISDSGKITLTSNDQDQFARLDDKTTNQRATELYEKDKTLNDLLTKIEEKLQSTLFDLIIRPASDFCSQLLNPAEDLPEPLNKPAPEKPNITAVPKLSHQLIRGYLYDSYTHFDDYDQILFPILYQTEFGESAEVDVFRISPEDAPSLIKERGEGADGRQKLAGNALFHFGAFLDRVWRENDIMWGRLDGAERLITALLPDPEYARVRDSLISEAHVAILKEEMPLATRKEVTGLLTQALIRASSGESLEEAVERAVAPLKSPKVKRNLETVMRACLENDQILAFVKQHYEVNRQLEPKPLLRSLARATQVTGKIFDDIAKTRHVDSKAIRWIARVGQLFWGLVEVAVPGSFANLLMFHWLTLLYLLEALLVVGGILFSATSVKNVGWALLALTFAINVAVVLLSDFMRGRKRWFRIGLVAIVLTLLFFSAVGIDNLFNLGGKGKVLGWLQSAGILPWLQTAKQWLAGLFR